MALMVRVPDGTCSLTVRDHVPAANALPPSDVPNTAPWPVPKAGIVVSPAALVIMWPRASRYHFVVWSPLPFPAVCVAVAAVALLADMVAFVPVSVPVTYNVPRFAPVTTCG